MVFNRPSDLIATLPMTASTLPPPRLGYDLLDPLAALKRLFRNFLVYLRFFVAFSIGREDFTRLEALKGVGRGSRALVLANGPSQEMLDPALLEKFERAGNVVFVVNHFFSNEKLSGLSKFHFVTSDPYWTSEDKGRAAEAIKKTSGYIFCPSGQVDTWLEHSSSERLITFCDAQVRTRGKARLAPNRPRSFMSMTALKALAIANWMGFDEIFVLGFDNTYFHDAMSDEMNRILTLERHAGESNYLRDRTGEWNGLADYFIHIALVFKDLEQFRTVRAVNLDPYSLTTVFKKVTPTESLESVLLGSGGQPRGA